MATHRSFEELSALWEDFEKSDDVLCSLADWIVKLPLVDANFVLSDLKYRMELIPEMYLERYETLRRGELDHIEHVRKCMQNLGFGDNNHDHSKDERYLLVTILFHSFKCPLTPGLTDAIIDEHYKKESHHPQFAEFNKVDLTKDDILEMCVDRMSRNLQFNKGKISEDNFKRYLPNFRRSAWKNPPENADKEEDEAQHADKLAHYEKCFENYKGVVKAVWKEMHPEMYDETDETAEEAKE